jgi:ring-1,2-phenylacetyl-CoA epoxidase subunit PaaE
MKAIDGLPVNRLFISNSLGYLCRALTRKLFMALKFHPLTVSEIRKETADTISVCFDVPEALSETFQYKQGQYLTLRTTIDGNDVRRSYSICSGVDENILRVAIKEVQDGVFSTWANRSLQVGDTLLVMPPQGRFYTEMNHAEQRKYLAFAAGSGITPILSILKTVLAQEPKSNFILFYGNRTYDQIIFFEELEALKSQYRDRLSVHHVLSREQLGSDLFYGRINGEKCAAYGKYFFSPAQIHASFLCGPEEMVFEVRDMLQTLGIAPERIHLELFTAPGAPKTVTVRKEQEHNTFDAQITVHQDDMVFEFTLPSDGSTILDAAMRAGADLPFSCRGGVCSTCKARILEGEVEMTVNYGLEPDELSRGYVLTCQAHPKSKKVTVSFDH